MTYPNQMVTLTSSAGVIFCFNPRNHPKWDIFDARSNQKIGFLEVDCESICTGVEIQSTYQRKGIATEIIKYLVNNHGLELYFWPPDGLKYDDGRHLSQEGFKLAKSLIKSNLAKWLNSENVHEDYQ